MVTVLEELAPDKSTDRIIASVFIFTPRFHFHSLWFSREQDRELKGGKRKTKCTEPSINEALK